MTEQTKSEEPSLAMIPSGWNSNVPSATDSKAGMNWPTDRCFLCARADRAKVGMEPAPAP